MNFPTSTTLTKRASVERAADCTNLIFTKLNTCRLKYKDFELLWAAYDSVHKRFSVPFCEGSYGKRSPQKRIKPIEFIRAIFSMLFHVIKIIYSIGSIMYIKRKNKIVVAVYSEDFYADETSGDPRFGRLFVELYRNNIPFVEFVRSNSGVRSAIKNILKRRRPVVYYESLLLIVNMLQRLSHRRNILQILEKSQQEYLINYFDVVPTVLSIRLVEKILMFIHVSKFVCWEFNSRTATLIVAAKCQKIKTIGMMHGAAPNKYMAHEFMSSFNSTNKLGPDVYGVWSNWWAQYYENHSTIYKEIVVSGMQRKPKGAVVGTPRLFKSHALWISEPLVPYEHVRPYILKMLENGWAITIKRRPFPEDVFYERLRADQDIFPSVKRSADSMIQAMLGIDLVVGCQSTAVLEGLFYGKNISFFNVPRWGNYFEVADEYILNRVEEVEDLRKNLESQCIETLRERFFGHASNDGITWLIESLKQSA